MPESLFPDDGPANDRPANDRPGKKKRSPRAPMLDVQVTREIIDTAVQRHSGYCMLAEAIKICFREACGREAHKTSVDLQTIRFSDRTKKERYIYITPHKCAIALVQFDAGAPIEPFQFRLKGAQVTRMHEVTEAGLEQRRNASKTGKEKRKRLRKSVGNGSVPDVIGGQAPPLQKYPPNSPAGDNVKVSRRREYGLRALMR